MNKGDTYCTMWNDNLSGPYVYDGKENINKVSCIVADEDDIINARMAIRILREKFTSVDDDGKPFLLMNFPDLFSEELIESELDLAQEKVDELQSLLLLSPDIRKLL